MDYSPPGPSVHGILQSRILEWVAISFSRGSSRARDLTWTCVSFIGGQVLYPWVTGEAQHLAPSFQIPHSIPWCPHSSGSYTLCLKITWRAYFISCIHPNIFKLSRSGWGLRLCISDKPTGDASAAGLSATLWEPLPAWLWSLHNVPVAGGCFLTGKRRAETFGPNSARSPRWPGQPRRCVLTPSALAQPQCQASTLTGFLPTLEQWSPAFMAPGTDYMGKNFSMGQECGGRVGVIQAHYIYCALYF